MRADSSLRWLLPYNWHVVICPLMPRSAMTLLYIIVSKQGSNFHSSPWFSPILACQQLSGVWRPQRVNFFQRALQIRCAHHVLTEMVLAWCKIPEHVHRTLPLAFNVVSQTAILVCCVPACVWIKLCSGSDCYWLERFTHLGYDASTQGKEIFITEEYTTRPLDKCGMLVWRWNTNGILVILVSWCCKPEFKRILVCPITSEPSILNPTATKCQYTVVVPYRPVKTFTSHHICNMHVVWIGLRSDEAVSDFQAFLHRRQLRDEAVGSGGSTLTGFQDQLTTEVRMLPPVAMGKGFLANLADRAV